jgi:hypothetical protein
VSLVRLRFDYEVLTAGADFAAVGYTAHAAVDLRPVETLPEHGGACRRTR